MTALLILFSAAVSYLFGSVNGAIVISKYGFKRDVRLCGSGNAGLTNFCRVFGAKAAPLVVLIDAAKAILPVLISGLVFAYFGGDLSDGRACALFFVSVGHDWPMFHEFKGGKSALCAAAAVWFIDWRVAAVCFAVFALIFITTRYVSLSNCLASVALPVCAALFGARGLTLLFIAAAAALLIFRHRGNINRLIKGTEPRMYY